MLRYLAVVHCALLAFCLNCRFKSGCCVSVLYAGIILCWGNTSIDEIWWATGFLLHAFQATLFFCAWFEWNFDEGLWC